MELKEKYWNGNTNKIIRYYFYSQRGLALFNEFRYIFMLIFGIYVTMKMSNPIWLLVMFLISIPILIIIGFIAVHHVAKVVDWLNIEFSTHFGRYQYTLLEEIRDELKSKNK